MHLRLFSAAATMFLLASALAAGTKPVPKNATVVDEGTFAVFQNGARIATEEFAIYQYADHNTTACHLRGEGTAHFEQSSELTLRPDGNLSRYEWKELAPAKSSATVEPGDQVLVLHSTGEDGKPIKDQSFFLAPDTFILDDYFFATREVLLWRYLASACRPRTSGGGCDLVRRRFPVLVPRQRLSAQVFVDFKGYEELPINGHTERLRHFVIQTEGPEWHLWLNDAHKLLRITLPSERTEILRQ